MEYEFEALEELIESIISLYKETPRHTRVPEFDEKRIFLIDQVAKLKKVFRSYLHKAENERRIEILIQHHQTLLIELVDKIFQYSNQKKIEIINDTTAEGTNGDLCLLAFKSLEELLTFIERYFSQYFDLDHKIPDAYLSFERTALKEIVTAIEKYAIEKEVDRRLIEITLFPINDFVKEDSGKTITYRLLIFLKGLVRDIASLFENSDEVDFQFEILQLMVFRNFNSHFLLRYITERVRFEVQSQPTILDQLDKLHQWLKLLHQSQVKPDSALNADMPSMKVQLTIWLKAEIRYLKKKKQMTLMFPTSAAVAGHDSFKVTTSLSVPQLGLFIRLLREEGLIKSKNQTELITFFAKHFTSAQNESISPDSLRVKYYNIEKAAVNSVQTILAKIVDRSKKGDWFVFYATSDLMIDSITDFLAQVVLV